MENYDTITSDDLPGLRADLCGYAEGEFSAGFREVCHETIAAIDVAIAEDVATNLRLKNALERFVRAGSAERLAQFRCKPASALKIRRGSH